MPSKVTRHHATGNNATKSTRALPSRKRPIAANETYPTSRKRAKVSGQGVVPAIGLNNATLGNINAIPREVLTVYVFGTGESAGDLGLGPDKKEAERPTIITRLDGRQTTTDGYRVVQLDCGGMHTIALTEDGRIVTWGGNDNGALGRDTNWDGGLRDIDAEEEMDDGDLNPLESTPTCIPDTSFPPGTKFATVAAGDSCSFAVTTTGLVYGWGTFVDAQGKKCFLCSNSQRIEKQDKPMLMPGLRNIKTVACGANHALALDSSGRVWSWGVNESAQVGRRARPQNQFMDSFYPGIIDLSRHGVRYIAAGELHSFAVDNEDRAFAWGANNFGQAGYVRNAGTGNAELPYPMQIRPLSKQGITVLSAASHHSTAVTAEGRFLVWGRLDGGHLGLKLAQEQLDDPKLVRWDEYGKPRILLQPLAVPGIGDAAHVACSTGHAVFVNREGRAFAAGYGFQYQLGNGTNEDSEIATEVKAKVLKDIKLTWCGAGGQFSMVAAPVAGGNISGSNGSAE
ncbi:hypothetical protein N8I77_012813 [Diaporthe amygdali]|uniref:RCC1-like domain-containing protein n=1 Tax=Phomopsis amygdali TaxID=1214568 RepID=A0AAD9S4L4_PHOAM|nr:hypothetical protein N8I77_012813 [Diaporthe amygdali]